MVKTVLVLVEPACVFDAFPKIGTRFPYMLRIGMPEPLPKLFAGVLVLGVANPNVGDRFPKFAIFLAVALAGTMATGGGTNAWAAIDYLWFAHFIGPSLLWNL
jgi:hypothetical protein